MSNLKAFCSFTSKISKNDENAFKAESFILLFSCLSPLWKRTNKSLVFSENNVGQKGRNVSNTLNPGRIPLPLGSLNKSQRLILNCGQALISLLKIEPAISPRVSAMCFFIERSASANRILNNSVFTWFWVSGVKLSQRLVYVDGANAERQSLSWVAEKFLWEFWYWPMFRKMSTSQNHKESNDQFIRLACSEADQSLFGSFSLGFVLSLKDRADQIDKLFNLAHEIVEDYKLYTAFWLVSFQHQYYESKFLRIEKEKRS